MKHTLSVFLIIIIPFYSISAQDVTYKNTISFQWGGGNVMRQDLVFSPFVHSDFSILNLALKYKREAKLYQETLLRFGSYSSSLVQPYEYQYYQETESAPPHTFTLVDLDYLLGKLVRSKDKYKLTIGGAFNSDIQALNYAYGRISSFGYNAAFGLGAFGLFEYKLNDQNRLTSSIQVPLLSWFARSPYLVNDDEFIENISSHSGLKTFVNFIGDGKLTSWNKIQYFDFNINYYFRPNQRWQYGANYGFEFIHSAQPRNLISFRNTLNASLIYNF